MGAQSQWFWCTEWLYICMYVCVRENPLLTTTATAAKWSLREKLAWLGELRHHQDTCNIFKLKAVWKPDKPQMGPSNWVSSKLLQPWNTLSPPINFNKFLWNLIRHIVNLVWFKLDSRCQRFILFFFWKPSQLVIWRAWFYMIIFPPFHVLILSNCNLLCLNHNVHWVIRTSFHSHDFNTF